MAAKIVGQLAKKIAKKAVSSGKKRASNKVPITPGKNKAVNKIQKGLDKTENRIPGRQMRSGLDEFNNKIYSVDGNTGKKYPVKGSNRKAVKALTPKRTPGVKKNKSLQRGINKSNRNLMK